MFKAKGSFWTGEVIRHILRNPFYKGKIIDDQQVIPALISEEEWNYIQEELTKRSRGGQVKNNKECLLRRLLRCGICGSTLWVVDTSRTRPNKPDYHYSKYSCGCRNITGVYTPYLKECTLPPVDIKKMDEIVWNRVSMTLLSDDKLKEALLSKENRSDIPSLEKKYLN